MTTLVSFHAHPDDEAIACGGTLARAAAEGDRTVLVFATRGEHGEVPDGFLEPGEELGVRREQEVHAAAEILGVHRVEFLGYTDSGMMGTPENDEPGSFWRADPDEASARLARILEEEKADVLTIYDENGTYGHPDHIQVHRVGIAAARRAGVRKVYESVVDRDRARRWFEVSSTPEIAELMGELEFPSPEEFESMGVPGELVTTRVDVSRYLDRKRRAMAAHASQISETSFFLALPPPLFDAVWGQEDYVLRDAPMGTEEDWLLT
ncbi:MAG TPA: PIG-L family deacetylase [Actinomycetota bacterium]|nr:PIG-L family deacetylase [Actinomycetota bacterium]